MSISRRAALNPAHSHALLLCISPVSGNKIVAAALLRHAQRSARLPCSTRGCLGNGNTVLKKNNEGGIGGSGGGFESVPSARQLGVPEGTPWAYRQHGSTVQAEIN
jgi:hypothetical protein